MADGGGMVYAEYELFCDILHVLLAVEDIVLVEVTKFTPF
jgi:hypothetical protein